MKTLVLDDNGVPVLSRPEIEERAEAFLGFFEPACLAAPAVTPLASIADTLQRKHGVTINFGTDLGSSREGIKYLGRFVINSNTIFVDRELVDKDPRFRFTLAHELGHFVLHRKLDIGSIRGGESSTIHDTENELAIYRASISNPMDWIEWQANAFAASLIAPRFMLRRKLEDIQRGMGINRHFGTSYVTDAVQSMTEYERTLERLCEFFQVSRASMRIRLDELSLVQIRQAKEIQVIGEILPDVFGEITKGLADT